jgi:ribosomal protein S10
VLSSNPKHPDESCTDFEMASHLRAMRLTDFDQKVPSDVEI